MIEGARLVHAETLGQAAEIDRRAVVDVTAVAARRAPLMTRSASSTTTLAPPRASASAAESPVKPPPITATSAVSGSGPGSAPVKAGAVSCQ